jgi:hypothetical protein
MSLILHNLFENIKNLPLLSGLIIFMEYGKAFCLSQGEGSVIFTIFFTSHFQFSVG